MTAKTMCVAAAAGAFVLASAARAQALQIHHEQSHQEMAQVHQELDHIRKNLAEFNGKQFVIQTFEKGSGPESKLVTGAPYSADEKSVTTQVLPDGNRIVNTNQAKLYRDSQGRTRMERFVKSQGGDLDKTVMINDPLTSSHYVLDESHRTAMKEARAMAMTLKKFAEEKSATRQTLLNGLPIGEKTEDLGSQQMEGVFVQGTRTTLTIPAGQIGNDRPIEIVSERWFSPDLQMVVMSKRNDPRMGETVYTVTNISRANPDPSLFQVPAGYTDHGVIKLK